MVTFLENVMTSHGYLAFILLAFLQACCIPISSEATWAFAGVIAATQPNKFSLLGVIVFGIIAEMAGALVAYAIGRRGGRTLLERYGKYVLVTRSDLDRAEHFFAGRGSWAVAVTRALPIVRTFAAFAAGVVEVPALAFTIFCFIGTAAWGVVLSLLGYNLGDAVTKFFNKFTYVGAALIIAFIAALIAHRVHALRKERHEYGGGPAGRDGQFSDRDDQEPGDWRRSQGRQDRDRYDNRGPSYEPGARYDYGARSAPQAAPLPPRSSRQGPRHRAN